jgi:hypothetical protein
MLSNRRSDTLYRAFTWQRQEEYTCRNIDWEGFVKYAIHENSYVMTYIPSFIKIVSEVQRLIGGIYRQHADHISLP